MATPKGTIRPEIYQRCHASLTGERNQTPELVDEAVSFTYGLRQPLSSPDWVAETPAVISKTFTTTKAAGYWEWVNFALSIPKGQEFIVHGCTLGSSSSTYWPTLLGGIHIGSSTPPNDSTPATYRWFSQGGQQNFYGCVKVDGDDDVLNYLYGGVRSPVAGAECYWTLWGVYRKKGI